MSQVAPSIPRGSFFFFRMPDLLARATRKGFWPMLDQGIVSIGNFLTTILVARGLSKPEYGQFGVVLEFMFFLNALQAGLVTYPLTIKGAIVDRDGLRRLVSASALLTIALAIPVILATLIVGGAMGKFALGASAVVALLIWQLQETLRRGQWAQFKHHEAILGDTISYVGQALAVFWLLHAGKLTLVNVFGAMTITSALAVTVQAIQIGLHRVRVSEIPAIARDFWKAGKWVAMSNFGTIATSICGSWPLYWFYGPEQVGEFFAIGNLLKLCNPVIQSITGMITPGAAKRLADHGIKAAQKQALKFATLGAAMLLPYLLFILVLPALSMRLTYGAHNHFLGRENLLRGCVIGYFCVYTSSVIGAFLNGIHKTRLTFYAQVITTISQFIVLLPAIVMWGLIGYVWGGVVQVAITMIVLLVLLRVALRKTPAA